MSSVPQTAAVAAQTSASPATSQGEDITRPEFTLAQIERIFAETDDDRFQQASVAFAASITGGKMGLLYVQEGTQLVPRVITTSDGDRSAFTAQQQVDLIAATAVSHQTSQRATVSLKNTRYVLLCVPFTISGQAPMALALLLGPDRAPFVEPAFTVLHLVTQLFVRRALGEHSASLRDGFDQATLMVDLFSRAAQATEFRQAMSILCDEMREVVGCSRVAIGLGTTHKVKIYGLSGAGRMESGSQSTSLLGGAMREGIGVDATMVWPERPDLQRCLTSASQDSLLETLGGNEVVTLPLKTEDGQALGAWSFVWGEESRLMPRQLDLIEAATPHAAALVHLSSQSHPRGLRGAIRRFQRGATKMKKAVWIALPIALVAFMLIPVPHRITADGQLQPERTRQIAAPFDGILERAVVKPGDTVEAGQLLAVLDGKEIRWRHAEAIARYEAAQTKRDQAMTDKRNVAAQQLAQLEADGLELEVALLTYQRDNLEVKAPISGVVLSGNLERSEGVPVSTGQKLFDIAPIDQLELEVSIPDAEISRVKEGQRVQLRLESQTGYRYESELAEVYPISEIQDDKNVFVGLAMIENEKGELRPGMRGKARIVSVHRPIGWIIFHRLWESIRMFFW
ncbi:MAG: efflux RND transporter periplasmic adaptor subunit [Verrucomicrobiota bacterium]